MKNVIASILVLALSFLLGVPQYSLADEGRLVYTGETDPEQVNGNVGGGGNISTDGDSVKINGAWSVISTAPMTAAHMPANQPFEAAWKFIARVDQMTTAEGAIPENGGSGLTIKYYDAEGGNRIDEYRMIVANYEGNLEVFWCNWGSGYGVEGWTEDYWPQWGGCNFTSVPVPIPDSRYFKVAYDGTKYDVFYSITGDGWVHIPEMTIPKESLINEAITVDDPNAVREFQFPSKDGIQVNLDWLVIKGEGLPNFNADVAIGIEDLGGVKAEGFVTVQKINDRWYFVDGNGNPFIQKGIVHTDLAQNHWQSEYGANWKTVVENDMIRMGFNSHGYHSVQFHSMNLKFYVDSQLLNISVYRNPNDLVDIFASAEKDIIRNKIVNLTNTYRNNTNLIGYMFTDVPDYSGWVNFIKGLGANAPGKIAYNNWKSNNPGANDNEFLSVIADEYFSFVSETFRANDPNHLLIGDNYGEWLGTQRSIIEVAARYVDVISVQPNWMPTMWLSSFWNPIYSFANRPMIISDFKMPFDIPEGDDYYIDNGRSQAESGQELVAYFNQFLSTEYMIGWSHCTYVNEHIGGLVKQGLYTRDGIPYTTYQNYIIQIHETMTNFVAENTRETSVKIESAQAAKKN